MRKYALLYNATTEKWRIIFQDENDYDKWYVETDVEEIATEGTARNIVDALNLQQRKLSEQ